jgi:NADH:ubiquinone oxidoreductase subunit 6 (subunit J)
LLKKLEALKQWKELNQLIEFSTYNVIFFSISSFTLISAISVGLVNSLMRSLFFLILTFIGVAGLFILLSADFIAIAQLLIYAGSISILLLFAVMLTPESSTNNCNSKYFLPGILIGIIFTYLMVALVTIFQFNQLSGIHLKKLDFDNTIASIGELLLGKYIIAFELASILLLFALIGAISIVRSNESDFLISLNNKDKK